MIFKQVPGHPEFFVSDTGRVFSVASGKFKELQRWANNQGYLRVCIRHKGTKYLAQKVHRLVCLAFNGPCPVGMECSHMDGDNQNNNYKNLQWMSSKDNNALRREHGTLRLGSKVHTAKLTEADIPSIRRRIANKERLKSIASDYGVKPKTIYSIQIGRNWTQVK